MKFLMLALLLGASNIADAESVYLTCAILQDGKDYSFDATLNEAEGTVVVTKGARFKGQAEFSHGKVRFVEVHSFGDAKYGTSTFITARTISRIDLTVEYEWKSAFRGEVDKTVSATGKCQRVEPPIRRF